MLVNSLRETDPTHLYVDCVLYNCPNHGASSGASAGWILAAEAHATGPPDWLAIADDDLNSGELAVVPS